MRLTLWTAATAWLCGHALFHFWEVAVGICTPDVLPRDFPAVTLPALIGIGLSVWAYRQVTCGRPRLSVDYPTTPGVAP